MNRMVEIWSDELDRLRAFEHDHTNPKPKDLIGAEMESGWVIEHGASEVSHPRYWGGVHGWTYDNLQAIRFCREEDARSQAEAMDDGFPDNYRIAEHGWG